MPAQIDIAVRDSPIDVAAESALMQNAAAGEAGAAVCFTGAVRGGDVRAMTLEHYPGMTESALRQIAEDAAKKWPLLAARILHRVGRMTPGEVVVFVGVCSAHRHAAFSACAFMTDYLKTRAPFWKKEEIAGGETRWVEARKEDETARKKWI
ncbi:MAG: molybdenum cofactor biosynthesis protein MoaE [Gammaproteobacteria bacterium]